MESGRGIDVPLHKMTTQPVTGPQRTFQVHCGPSAFLPEVRALERLWTSLHDESTSVDRHHRETTPGDGHTLTQVQGLVQRRPDQRKPPPRSFFDNLFDVAQGFNEARKHNTSGKSEIGSYHHWSPLASAMVAQPSGG